MHVGREEGTRVQMPDSSAETLPGARPGLLMEPAQAAPAPGALPSPAAARGRRGARLLHGANGVVDEGPLVIVDLKGDADAGQRREDVAE
jgi:hypothetical protein